MTKKEKIDYLNAEIKIIESKLRELNSDKDKYNKGIEKKLKDDIFEARKSMLFHYFHKIVDIRDKL